MNTQEFSIGFDILYNNVSSNAAPGLNEHEKSFFLTKAQNEVLSNHFNPKGNKYQEGFDGSQKRQIDFSNIICFANPVEIDTTERPVLPFDERGILFDLPTDILYILNETATIKYDNKYSHKINIVPITFEEYSMFISKPYKQPFKNQGWRLIQKPTVANENHYIAEIIVKEGAELSSYAIRYVRKPKPIILMDFDDNDNGEVFSDISVEGYKTRTECELDSSLHQEILQRAVELAKSAYIGDINSTIQLGGRSE